MSSKKQIQRVEELAKLLEKEQFLISQYDHTNNPMAPFGNPRYIKWGYFYFAQWLYHNFPKGLDK